VSKGSIAIVAQYSKTGRKIILNKPQVYLSSLSYLFSMLFSTSINVIYAKKLSMKFFTTSTFGRISSVMNKTFCTSCITANFTLLTFFLFMISMIFMTIIKNFVVMGFMPSMAIEIGPLSISHKIILYYRLHLERIRLYPLLVLYWERDRCIY